METITLNKKSVWKEVRDYLFILVAMLLYAIGWTVFLLPNNITTGGVPGISSIVYWGLGIPVQYTYFVINFFLLIAALKTLGLRFCLKTIFAVICLTFLTAVLKDYGLEAKLLSDQPFMASIIGAVFCGTSVGLGLSVGGSTGGTDIVAAIVHKYRDISLGRVILICDVVIISIVIYEDDIARLCVRLHHLSLCIDIVCHFFCSLENASGLITPEIGIGLTILRTADIADLVYVIIGFITFCIP